MKPSEIAQAATKGVAEELIKKEITRKLLEADRQFSIDMDTMVLWTLHKTRGWGAQRLKQFYIDMFAEHIRMREFYELGDMYPERHHLKEIGADVESWHKELFDEEGNFRDPREVKL